MVIRDADAKKTMASEAYQKSIEVAKKSGTGNDLEKIRRRAEKKNHYLCIVPQYKIDQGTGSSISENVSIREGEKIKPWLDNLYDAICCEGNDISCKCQCLSSLIMIYISNSVSSHFYSHNSRQN
jgi:hypothetical protein